MKLSTNPSNIRYRNLIKKLWKSKRRVWRSIASKLNKPNSKRIAINISKINRNTKENDIVVVPGKVLSSGDFSHKISSIAAVSFSKSARSKIEGNDIKAETIEELYERNPTGKNVKIIM
ncbi:MAG: 50S ribosomal protein L18e [Candidatus Lokiarchaeota archaeon]|nr:50S ribosomal protein L18e [Candidatus Lokiarchaeota archaeon]